MKRFGFGLLAAVLLAAATLMTTAPAMAGRGGSGMIWFPPMGGGMGGGWNGDGMRGWNGGGMYRPGNNWRAPGGRNYYAGKNYNGRWNGNVPGRNWNGQHWNGKNWNGRHWNNWYRNGRWHGPRYRYRYPGYNYFNNGFWYPWPWWSYNRGWNFEVGDAFAGGSYASNHVQWCMNRYRSYNPRTDTYTGYDGKKHRCRGPY